MWALPCTWAIVFVPVLYRAVVGLDRFLSFTVDSLAPSHVMHGLAALLLLSYLAQLVNGTPPPEIFRRIRVVALFVLAAALGAWMVLAVPKPPIDVWEVCQQGARIFLTGESPYAGGVRALDANTFARYIEDYDYPPLNLVLTTVSYADRGDALGPVGGDDRRLRPAPRNR